LGAGAGDVFVDIDGMHMGMGMEEEVTLRAMYFVGGRGSVKVDSYSYDEPSNENDPRLIPFGDVPPIVFSEAMGDLGKVAGQQAATPHEATGAVG
jgi:hypothetical protein